MVLVLCCGCGRVESERNGDGEDSERETFEELLNIDQSMGAEDKCVGEPSENDNEMANSP